MAKSPPTEQVASSIWTSSTLSACLAGVLVIEILGIGIYANYRIRRFLDPNHLADRAEAALRENYPEFRKELITQVRKQAPELAEEVSHEILAAAPDAREQLERLTQRQIQNGLAEATHLSAEQFRVILNENRDTVIKAFDQIEAAPEEAERLVLQTEARIDKTLGIDLRNQARQALRFHRQLNDKLEHLLNKNDTLTSQELLERRIVRILKAIEIENLGEERVAKW
jgi:hypothetical protein